MTHVSSSYRPETTGAGRPAKTSTAKADTAMKTGRARAPIVVAFVLSLLVPIAVNIGGIVLFPHRLLLLVLFIPMLIMWTYRKYDRAKIADIFVILAFVWAAATFIIHHGTDGTQAAGIVLIEAVGAYLLGALFVKDQRDFEILCKMHFAAILLLLPVAIAESVTGYNIVASFISRFVRSHVAVLTDMRFGLYRARVVFEHPILFGVFCASGFGTAIYVLNRDSFLPAKIARIAVVLGGTALSLSTGPLIAANAQIFSSVYDLITKSLRKRWTILIAMLILMYITIDLLSNRTPFHVLVSYASFDSGSAYARILIFHFGMEEVYRHPLLGIGYNDWARPSWLGPSVDNFWLLLTIRHGIPTFVLLALGIIVLVWRASRLEIKDARVAACRAGYLTSLIGMVVAACTVHFWNVQFCWFMFFLGSGTWLLRSPARAESTLESLTEHDQSEAQETGRPSMIEIRYREPQPPR